MSKYRNPIKNIETKNVAGNVMQELKEADLVNFSAGEGAPKASGGMICTSTAECATGSKVVFCC